MTSDYEILDALKDNMEIELSVKGRVTGKVIPRPVWFALSKDAKSIFLIPVNGRKTQWYLNVKKEPEVTVRVGGRVFTGSIAEVGMAKFKEVVEAFTARYGGRDMKEYYPNLEVALEVPLPTRS
jgi:hypothetical protein